MKTGGETSDATAETPCAHCNKPSGDLAEISWSGPALGRQTGGMRCPDCNRDLWEQLAAFGDPSIGTVTIAKLNDPRLFIAGDRRSGPGTVVTLDDREVEVVMQAYAGEYGWLEAFTRGPDGRFVLDGRGGLVIERHTGHVRIVTADGRVWERPTRPPSTVSPAVSAPATRPGRSTPGSTPRTRNSTARRRSRPSPTAARTGSPT